MPNMPKIDEADAKILKALLAESRTSFTTIAAECGITVTAVRMRYKRLWKEGVINGEKILVNPHYLGYRYIIDLGIINFIEKEKEVAKFLEEKPYISQVVGPLGNYNFYGKVALKDLRKLPAIIEDLQTNRDITEVRAFIWAEAANIEHPENLIIKPLTEKNPKKINQTYAENLLESGNIDELDRKIAVILCQNSRTPFNKIAKILNVSPKTVIQRYKKLRERLLTLSTITVDLSKIGYTALANLYIKTSNHSTLSEIRSQLLKIPNLIVVIRLIDSSFDLYAAIALEDFDKLFLSIEKIRRIKGIDTTEVIITKMPLSWPFNLFPSLLTNEAMLPKFWQENRS